MKINYSKQLSDEDIKNVIRGRISKVFQNTLNILMVVGLGVVFLLRNKPDSGIIGDIILLAIVLILIVFMVIEKKITENGLSKWKNDKTE